MPTYYLSIHLSYNEAIAIAQTLRRKPGFVVSYRPGLSSAMILTRFQGMKTVVPKFDQKYCFQSKNEAPSFR